jgi:large subunit ribosomal protein L30
MPKKLKITQIRSVSGRLDKQISTLSALGLRRIRQIVIKNDSPQIRGMIEKVRHLVKVEETEE